MNAQDECCASLVLRLLWACVLSQRTTLLQPLMVKISGAFHHGVLNNPLVFSGRSTTTIVIDIKKVRTTHQAGFNREAVEAWQNYVAAPH